MRLRNICAILILVVMPFSSVSTARAESLPDRRDRHPMPLYNAASQERAVGRTAAKNALLQPLPTTLPPALNPNYGVHFQKFGAVKLIVKDTATQRPTRVVYEDGTEIELLEFRPDTGAIQSEKHYDKSGLKTARYDYYSDGLTEKKISYVNGEVDEFYESGRLKYTFRLSGTSTPPSPTGDYKEYTDESYGKNDAGYVRGRAIRTAGSYLLNAVLSNRHDYEQRNIEFWPGTDIPKVSQTFLSETFGPISGEHPLKLLVTTYCDKFGMPERAVYPDGSYSEYVGWSESDGNPPALFEGRQFNAAGELISRQVYTVWPGTDHVKTRESFKNGQLELTEEYYKEGLWNRKKTSYANGDFEEYYKSGRLKNRLKSGVYEEFDDLVFGDEFMQRFPGAMRDENRRLALRRTPDGKESRFAYYGDEGKIKSEEQYDKGALKRTVRLDINGNVTFDSLQASLGIPALSAGKGIIIPLKDLNGGTFELQGSEDLVSWTTLATIEGAVQSQIELKDTQTPHRFYRLASVKPALDVRYLRGKTAKSVELYAGTSVPRKIGLTDGSVYEYYESGNLKSETNDKERLEYYDDNFYKGFAGKGRLKNRIKSDGSGSRFLAYWPDTDVVKIEESYTPGGQLYSTLYDDERGRYAKAVRPNGDYTERIYWPDDAGEGQAGKTKEFNIRGSDDRIYQQWKTQYWENGSVRLEEYYYRYPNLYTSEEFYRNGMLKKKTYGSGLSYENYESGTLKNLKTITGVYEEYEDGALFQIPSLQKELTGFNTMENFSVPLLHGRLKLRRTPDGKESRFLAYFGETNQVKIEEQYENGKRVRTIEYDMNGGVISTLLKK